MPIPWWRRNFLGRRRLDQIFLDLPDAVIRRATGRRHWPPYSLRSFVGGAQDFDRVGRAFLHNLKDLNLFSVGTRVLDIGCGCGRLSHPLATDRLLQNYGICYVGVDVDRLSVEWCKRNVSPLNPKFVFEHADCFNLSYNPLGTESASAYRFPYRDGSFDLVLMTSVCTHLLVDDLVHYLSEVSRLLAPDGVVYSSFFLRRPSEDSASAFRRHGVAFPNRYGSCAVNRDDFPNNAVAYDENFIRHKIQEHRMMVLEPIRYGAQDVLLLARQPDPEDQPQLEQGWHELEEDRWRWTKPTFEVTFRQMPANCSKLRFQFSIPQALLNQVGEVRLSAAVGNQSMPVTCYTTAGPHTYEHDLPLAGVTGGMTTISFRVEKPYRPVQDQRELGIQVPFWTPLERTLRRLCPISIV